MRITVLCDNSVGPIAGTLGEHGFAALVEGGAEPLLFDTGYGETLLHNARRLGRDLRHVHTVVLSHGHCDHTGGLLPLLQTTGPKKIHAHPALFTRRYRVRHHSPTTPIGIPYDETFLRASGADFVFSDSWREIMPNAFLTGEVPRATSFETTDAGLFCDEAGCLPDHVTDDQSLVIDAAKGLVLLLGCCHAGLINTIRYAQKMTGRKEVYAVIGGTHLGFSTEKQIEETVKALRELKVEKVYGSHCTGFAAAARLWKELPGRYHPASVGFTLEI